MTTRLSLVSYALLASLSATAGCDTDPADDPAGPGAAAGPVGKADGAVELPSQVVFSRDARPVDGALTELRIEQGDYGTYDAILRTAWFDRFSGQEVEHTEVVATDLDCAFDLSQTVVCSRDDRPVDGALVVLRVSQDEDDQWDATLRTALHSRAKGGEIDETEEIASNLLLEQDGARFERDARPVDGALTQISIESGAWGHDVALRTAYFDRIGGEEVDVTEVVASGLDCDFGEVVYCERDDLPVDGALVELLVLPGEFGGYDATLTTSWVDRLAGELVSETQTLGTGLNRTL